MKPALNRFLSTAITTVLALSSSAHAADRTKQNNTTNLSLAGSWDTLPGSSDIAVFDSTYATTGTLNTGALVTWQGLRVAGPGGNVVINNSTAGQEIALGSSGIDLSAATVNLNIQRLRVDASQTWNVAAGRTFNLGSSSGPRTGVLSLGSGGPFTITKSGAGTAQLDTSNTAIGNVNWDIQGGVVRAIWNGSSAWGTGTITLGGGGIATGTPFTGSVGNWTWNNNITLTSSTSSFIDNQNIAGSDRWLKLTGAISGSGALEFRDTGTGYTNANFGHILAGTNTNTGTVTIASGAEVRVGATTSNDGNTGNNGKLAADSALVINNGTLSFSRLDSHTVANSISGSGQVRIGLSATVGTATTTQVVTLSGSNTYLGATTVNNGRLVLSGSLTSNISVQPTAKISGTGTTTGTLTTAAGSGIVLNGGGTTTSLTANGVNIGGATTVSFLTNPTAATSYDVLTYGNGGITGEANLTAAWRGSFVNDTINKKYTFLTGAAATRTWNTTSGTWDNTGANTNWLEDDLKFYDSDSAIFGNIAADSLITLSGTISPTAVTVQNVANTYTFQTGSIAGPGTLAKTNGGTLILAAANSFSGATTIDGGTLRVAHSQALQNSTVTNNVDGGLAFATGVTSATFGALAGSGNVSLSNAGSAAVALTVGGNNASTSYSGQISGAGSLIKTGTGTLTLAQTNSYTGLTTLSGGTLKLTADTALGSGISNSTDQTSAVVDFGANTLTLGNTTAGNSGAFFYGKLDGTGTLMLRGGSQTIHNSDGTGGSGGGNYQIFTTTAATMPTTAFALNTGASTADRKDFGFVNDTNNVLTLSSLTGYGAIRTDAGGIAGDTVTRLITVDQSSGDTIFNGALLSHKSGANAVRALTFEKRGSSTLELAGFIGKETASATSGTAAVNLIANGGVLNITNAANTTTTNTDAISLGTVTVTAGTLAFSNQALVNTAGTAGATSILMNGGSLRWNSGNSQDLTAGATSRLALVADKAATFDTQENSVTFANALGGGAINASLVKTGTGSLTLEGANEYTGTTTVANGTLVINGSVSTGLVRVETGATLKGSGMIGGATTIESGATLSPGSSPGLLTINNALTLEGATLMEIGGQILGTEYDSINVTGLLSYGGDLSIVSHNAYNLAQAASYTLFNLGSETGTFDTVTVGALSLVNSSGVWSAESGGFTYTFTESTGQLAVVPEPAAALLGGLGMFLLLRRKR